MSHLNIESASASTGNTSLDTESTSGNALASTLGTSISRRDALKALMAVTGTAALFSAPRSAFAATATQETLNALASAEDQLAAVQTQLGQLETEFEELSIKQDQTISQIEDVQAQIDDTQKKIDKKQAELEKKQDALSERVSDSYKKGPMSTLNLLLASESFDELLSNSHYVDKVNDADRQMIDEIQTIRTELEKQKKDLEEQKSDLETLKAEQEQGLADMKAKQAETQTLIDGLSQDVKDLMAQRDAEYLAAVQEEERQRQAAENAGSSWTGGGVITGGTKSLERVLSSARATPSPGAGLCAMWVSQVFSNAGFSYPGGNACDQYSWWCTSSDRSNLKPGMIIAVPSHPHTSAGRIYGHVGIYMGGGTVMDNVGYIRSIGVDSWISYYGATITPRWGWVFGTALA